MAFGWPVDGCGGPSLFPSPGVWARGMKEIERDRIRPPALCSAGSNLTRSSPLTNFGNETVNYPSSTNDWNGRSNFERTSTHLLNQLLRSRVETPAKESPNEQRCRGGFR